MEFIDNNAIYLQIADYVADRILLGDFKENEKITSIRELAIKLEVNPNTVQRSYEYLQQKEVLFTQRGRGYFTSQNGKDRIKAMRKEDFLKNDLPRFFRKMQLLEMDLNEVASLYDFYIEGQSNLTAKNSKLSLKNQNENK